MKKLIFVLLIGAISSFTFGQGDGTQYNFHANKADSLYNAKEYKKSAIEFQKAFDSTKGAYQDHVYKAACSFAMSGNSEKAFEYLFRIVEHPRVKYVDHERLTSDSKLNSLHSDKQWKKLINIVKANKEEVESKLDKELIAILDTVYQEDQTYRRQIRGMEARYGRNSKEMKAHWKLIREKDSINLIKVKKILDERGWLGSEVIGKQGNSTLFLVIQHSDLEVQEKYLPMMREAVKKGNARANGLALLEDRVAIRKGGKQIYGSQIGRDKETGDYYVLPLIEPENVDKRRAEVGLGTIQQYISVWGMTWSIEEYKKNLKKYERK